MADTPFWRDRRRTTPYGQDIDVMRILGYVRTALTAARATQSAPSGSERSTSMVLHMTKSVASESYESAGGRENTSSFFVTLAVNDVSRLTASEEMPVSAGAQGARRSRRTDPAGPGCMTTANKSNCPRCLASTSDQLPGGCLRM